MSSNFIPTSFAILSLMIVCMYYSLTLLRCRSDDLKNFVMTRQWREVHKFPHLSSFLTKDQLDDVFMSFPSLTSPPFPPLRLAFLSASWERQASRNSLSHSPSFSATPLSHSSDHHRNFPEDFEERRTISQECVERRRRRRSLGAIFTAANE